VWIVLLNLLVFWCSVPVILYLAGHGLDIALGLPRGDAAAAAAGAVMAASGLALALWSMLLLKVKGRGLPISSLPPERFVTVGPYRHFRHPIYTAYVFLAAGLALILGSFGTAFIAIPALAVVWFLTWVKLYEEPGLLARFGADYRVHMDRTPLFLPLGGRRLLRRIVLFLFRAVFKVRTEGSRNVPDTGAVVIVADHLSYMDFLFVQYITARHVRIPVSAEVFRRPLQRWFLGLMGGVPTRRFCSDPAAALALADEIRAGGVVGVAVEAERSWTGEMSLPRGNVARNILALDAPVVPVAFRGSYRFWPRWAGGFDRSVRVTVKVGRPFKLAAESGGDPGSAAHIIREKISELKAPDETSVNLAAYSGPRPQLVLWRCPVCGAEESLAFCDGRWLDCSECGARWDAGAGDLVLSKPADRSGETGSIAAWSRKAGLDSAPRLDGLPLTARCELRECGDARLTLVPLRSGGIGEATLSEDGLVWRGDGVERVIPIHDMDSLTTERNDTLQLGIGMGVIQLVMDEASPLRWLGYLEELRARGSHDGMEDGAT